METKLYQRMKIKYLFTLRDCIYSETNEYEEPYNASDLPSLIELLGITISSTFLQLDNPYISQLWQMIYARNLNEGVYESESNQYDYKEFKAWMIRLINLMIFTQDRYMVLLNLYNKNKNDLLKQISTTSESKTRFNDTPQDEGVFESDPHTTNLTQASITASTDKDTIIIRLREIQDNYMQVMTNWLNEFEILFIRSANYEE